MRRALEVEVGGFRLRAGDLEPARALGRRRARRRARGRPGRDRQGGPGQRAAHRARRRRGRLTAAATERGTTPDALALAAVLAQPWADVVLSGAATVDTLRSNLAAIDAAWDAQAEEALAPLAEPAEEYWERRSELAWN